MGKTTGFIVVLLIGSFSLPSVSYGQEKVKSNLSVSAKRVIVLDRRKLLQSPTRHPIFWNKPGHWGFPLYTGGVLAYVPPDSSPLAGFIRSVRFFPEYLLSVESSRTRTNHTTPGFFSSSVSFLKAQKHSTKTPPLNAVRITSQVLGGSAVGFGLGYLTASLGSDVYSSMVYGMGGYLLGSTIGVYLVGNIGDETGSFRAALLGSLTGWLTSYVLAAISTTCVELDDDSLTLLILALPPIGATVGFNRSRKYK